ncbi:MAG: ArnT family glycosyltransferase, partial [Steroidobacteraceae bacterium]
MVEPSFGATGIGSREAVRAGPLERLLTGFASLFETWRPRSRAQRLELATLALILIGGAVLRFWQLGAVGLHGDEDSMALATLSIVHHGTPVLPSGMFYPRGTLELYLMAASVMAFGASEWAFRIPSALCGVLLVALAWHAGRRYLTSPWNLAFTAAVALLPVFIEDAQTARMYVFLVTSVAAFVTLVFEWERTGRGGFLAAAVAVLIIGITLHQLAVFATFIVLYPGLVRGDARKLIWGVLAFGAIVAAYFLISYWIDLFYPATPQLPGVPPAVAAPVATGALPRLALPALIVGCAIALALAAWVARAIRQVSVSVAAGALIAIAVVAELLAFDHVAFLALVASVVLAARGGRTSLRRAGLVVAASAVWVAFDLWRLHHHGIDLRQSVGALTGWPSIWPYFAMAHDSLIAAAALAVGIAWGCWQLAHGRCIPDFLLFAVLGVWMPLLLIGVFMWSIPPRYVAAESFPMLLGAFAALQWIVRAIVGDASAPAREAAGGTGEARSRASHAWLHCALAAVLCALVANPAALARTAYAGYADHPDHQGAARYIRSQHPGPRDIVVAEDDLEQTYYLGHVNFWLLGIRMASQFVYERHGRLEDFYT